MADGQEFTAGVVSIQVRELPHCPMPDGSAGPQNTGYLINRKLFHAGDGKELANLNVEVLVAAMLGPDVSVRDTCDFAKQVGAKTVIPIHYDVFNASPDFFVNVTDWFSMPFKVQPLGIGQSAEI